MKLFAVIFLSAFICSTPAFAMQCDMHQNQDGAMQSEDGTKKVPSTTDGKGDHKCDMKKSEECKYPDCKKGADHKCDMKNPDDCKKHKGDQAAINADLTLVQVMQDLASQLSRIQSGILSGNRMMIAEGALRIANHPSPKGGLKPYITKNSGDLMEVVKEMDGTVHQTAIKMAELAHTVPMSELHEMLGRVSGGCVKCHEAFRD